LKTGKQYTAEKRVWRAFVCFLCYTPNQTGDLSKHLPTFIQVSLIELWESNIVPWWLEAIKQTIKQEAVHW